MTKHRTLNFHSANGLISGRSAVLRPQPTPKSVAILRHAAWGGEGWGRVGKSGRAHPQRRARAGPREEGGAERPGVTGPSPSRGSDSARSARAEWQCAAGQPALPSEGHGLLSRAAARPALTAAPGGHAARECHCGNTLYDAFSGK